MQAFLHAAVATLCLGQNPGTIAVVDDELAVVTLPLAAGSAYSLTYPTSIESVWFDRGTTRYAAPQTIYHGTNKGDFDGNGIVDGRDVQGFVATLITGPFDARADFDDSGQLDFADVTGFVEYTLGGYSVGVVLYAQGLSASSALGDGQINLLINSTVSQTRPVTVVDVNVSPTTVSVGDVVTVQMTPAIAPLAFDQTTSASWSGQIQPVIGQAIGPLTLSYPASQFRENAANQAVLVVGDGTVQGLADVSTTEMPVTFLGTLAIHMGSLSASKHVSFFPVNNPYTINKIDYDDDSAPHLVLQRYDESQ